MYENLIMIRRYLILLLLCFQTGISLAQAAQEDQHCTIHLNKSFYVTGEVVWYKVYLPSTFKGRNVTLRAGMWDRNGQLLDAVFHKTEGETFVEGYYPIPFDLKSDVYHLVVAGADQASKSPVVLAEALVPIYNDLERDIPPLVVKSREAHSEDSAIETGPAPVKVTVELLSNPVQRRGKVQARIRVQDESGYPVAANLSVSVRDHSLTKSDLPEAPNLVAGKTVDHDLVSILDSAITYRGTLTDSLGHALQANLLGIYSAQEQRFIYTKSDTGGRFSLELADFYDQKPIQFLDYQYEDIEVRLRTDMPVEKAGELIYTPQIVAYLNASRQRKKVYQMHNAFEYLLEVPAPTFDQQTLLPDQQYPVKDYQRFESVPVFFREITTPLKFREDQEGNLTIKMFNPTNGVRRFFNGSPLFIVDGKLTRNVDFIANLDIDQIDYVDMFYDFDKLRRYFSALGINGVAKITTSIPNLMLPPNEESDIFIITGIQPSVNLPGTPEANQEVAANAPFLQPQLYWNPNLRTDENGELLLEFKQSDDLSTFRIEVVAQGVNGALGIGRLDYEAQP